MLGYFVGGIITSQIYNMKLIYDYKMEVAKIKNAKLFHGYVPISDYIFNNRKDCDTFISKLNKSLEISDIEYSNKTRFHLCFDNDNNIDNNEIMNGIITDKKKYLYDKIFESTIKNLLFYPITIPVYIVGNIYDYIIED